MDLLFGGEEAQVADVEGGGVREFGFQVGGFGAVGGVGVGGWVVWAGVSLSFLVLWLVLVVKGEWGVEVLALLVA